MNARACKRGNWHKVHGRVMTYCGIPVFRVALAGSGPGDNAGRVCDQNNSSTVMKPFSRTKFASTVTPTVLEN
jgi:hypothetical protein